MTSSLSDHIGSSVPSRPEVKRLVVDDRDDMPPRSLVTGNEVCTDTKKGCKSLKIRILNVLIY